MYRDILTKRKASTGLIIMEIVKKAINKIAEYIIEECRRFRTKNK